ncbi:MAG TPA: DegV family protein [Anaerolineae bacterium]|nr:DegV family protein [Anaerolineae bacterium]
MSVCPIAIIADSTCDIPAELLERYHIDVIPQLIIWGNQELRDRVDIQPAEFYQRLTTASQLPTTSQPTVKSFSEHYQAAQAAGATDIVVLTVSSAMSGTYQTALQVAQLVEVPVHVFDAKGPTMSLGWQALAAARAREAGADLAGIIAVADRVRQTVVQFVYLDTLEYLYRGGRIGNATRFIGALLDLKPLVEINHATGLVEGADRVRTRRKGVETLYQRFFEKFAAAIVAQRPLHIAVLHGGVPEEAALLAERIQREYQPAELLINITGPVLGLHTGPRALALCGYFE